MLGEGLALKIVDTFLKHPLLRGPAACAPHFHDRGVILFGKDTDFLQGRRKRRNYLFIPFVVLLALVSVLMVTFYGLQKYAVISDESVRVELPILSDGTTATDSQGPRDREL